MDHFLRELKPLLRLVLILFRDVALFTSTRISTGGQLRMKNFQTLRLLCFVNGAGTLTLVGKGRVFSVGISGVWIGRKKIMNKRFYPDQSCRCLSFLFASLASFSVSSGESRALALKLPAPVTSFGACVAGNALYVYGGHRGEAHVYSRETHSRHFVRVDLAKMDKWEELPFREPLQGFGMAAHEGRIYLAGGSQATNEPGTRSNLTSTAEVSVFDPASKTWSLLPPLPTPRSSHELLVEDGKLYVVGGWSMANGKGVEWFDHSLMADLSKKTLKWEKIPQPNWLARAHSSVILDSRLFVIGGLDENGTTDAVRVLDLKTRRWGKVSDYPSVNSLKAFGSAACVSEGRVVACSYSYQPRILDESNSTWRPAQAKVMEKRFFHRMIPRQAGEVLFVGGANHDGHLDSIEVLNFSDDSDPQPGANKPN